MSEKPHCVIVGGGAAGFFAAIHCAEATPGRRVSILEQSPRLLAKVRISGGGRCNLTHHCFEPRRLIEAYPRGGRELRGPFHKWQPRDTVAWFESRGVPTKVEEDGRIFPVSDDSGSVIDALLGAARAAGVEIFTSTAMEDLVPDASGGFRLALKSGDIWRPDRVLIATGGLKPGRMSDLIEQFGHRLTPLAPSLFTFHITDPRIADLAGISVPRARVSLPALQHSQVGPVLVTHWGLSGPAILKLSAWAARELQAVGYQAELEIAWASQDAAELRRQFKEERRQHGKRQLGSHPLFDLPKRLWQRLVEISGIAPDTSWSRLTKPAEERLLEELSAGRYRIKGKSMNKEEFVTCGGVDLPEVDFRTMESRLVPGLHFAGEVLDIDALTGGYNFQAAWTTGRLAGLAMAEARRS